MAKINEIPPEGRTTRRDGRIVTKKVRGGGLTISGWPRKRGQSSDPDIQAQNRDYGAAQRHSTRPWYWDHLSAFVNSEGTIWNWREMIIKAAYGTLAEITLPGGIRIANFTTMKNEINAWLDTLSMDIGSMVVRTNIEWSALAPGLPGQVLTTAGPGSLPAWQTPSTDPDSGFQWATDLPAGGASFDRGSVGTGFDLALDMKLAAVWIEMQYTRHLRVRAEIWKYDGSGLLTTLLDSSAWVEKDWVIGEQHVFEFLNRPVLPAAPRYVVFITANDGVNFQPVTLVVSGTAVNGFPKLNAFNAICAGAQVGAGIGNIGSNSNINGFKWALA